MENSDGSGEDTFLRALANGGVVRIEKHNPNAVSIVNVEESDFVDPADHPGLEDIAEQLKAKNVLVDIEGREFHPLKEEWANPVDQMFLTRLLRGVIPVADVVVTKDKGGENHFYSCQLDLSGTNEVEDWQNSEIFCEMAAESLILKVVFSDDDHLLEMKEGKEKGLYIFKTFKNCWYGSEFSGRFWYDFHLFGNEFWTKSTRRGYLDVSSLPVPEDGLERVRQIVDSKLGELDSWLGGEAGLDFMLNIVRSIKNESGEIPSVVDVEMVPKQTIEERVRFFQKEVLDRIRLFRERINQ